MLEVTLWENFKSALMCDWLSWVDARQDGIRLFKVQSKLGGGGWVLRRQAWFQIQGDGPQPVLFQAEVMREPPFQR